MTKPGGKPDQSPKYTAEPRSLNRRGTRENTRPAASPSRRENGDLRDSKYISRRPFGGRNVDFLSGLNGAQHQRVAKGFYGNGRATL